MENFYVEYLERAQSGDDAARRQWIELFRNMGRELGVKVQPAAPIAATTSAPSGIG